MDNYESMYHSRSRVLGQGVPRAKFNPRNVEHRKAYATWELTGKWPIKFETEWPYVTVPQTVLAHLARYACNEQFKSVCKEKKVELKPGFESYAFQ